MNDRGAIGQIERGLEGFRQALLQVVADLDAIDDDTDVVLALLVERRHVVQLDGIAVDHRAHEPLGSQLADQLLVLALAALDHRRQQHQPGALGQCQYLVDHLRDRLGLELFVVVRAPRRPGASEQQAQVVVDLGDRADGGAGVVRGRFLLDGNGWRQSFDMVDVGLFHHRQELAGVGRQGLDVASLPFGVKRVECERRFTRTG